MKRWKGVAAALAVLASASGAAAQDPEHQNSIALSVGGGTTIGYWMPISGRADLGLQLGLSLSDGENDADVEQTAWSVSGGPAIKLYATRESPFRPYTFGALNLAFGRSEQSTGTTEASIGNRDVGVNVGLGLDWFPVSRVSVGGHVGVGASYGWTDFETPTSESESSGFDFNTFTSGIRVHLYL